MNDSKYQKAREMLQTSNQCPSVIAYLFDIDRTILHDATRMCETEEWQGGCDWCREDALKEMESVLRGSAGKKSKT